MNEFLEMHYFPRLNQEEVKYMNRPVTSKLIESLLKKKKKTKLPTNKSPEPDSFSGEFYHTFKGALISILLKPFQKRLQ